MKERLAKALLRLSQKNVEASLRDPEFTGAIDELAESLYADITGIKVFESLRDVFYILTIKVLCRDRQYTNADAVLYVAQMLARFSKTEAAPPIVERLTGSRNIFQPVYPISLEDSIRRIDSRTQATVYQFVGDRALFIAGTYPETREADPEVQFGRECYNNLAESWRSDKYRRGLFSDLAIDFPTLVEGLNEMARNFLREPNRKILTGLMLDAIDSHKKTGDEKALARAQAYARLLHQKSSFR